MDALRQVEVIDGGRELAGRVEYPRGLHVKGNLLIGAGASVTASMLVVDGMLIIEKARLTTSGSIHVGQEFNADGSRIKAGGDALIGTNAHMHVTDLHGMAGSHHIPGHARLSDTHMQVEGALEVTKGGLFLSQRTFLTAGDIRADDSVEAFHRSRIGARSLLALKVMARQGGAIEADHLFSREGYADGDGKIIGNRHATLKSFAEATQPRLAKPWFSFGRRKGATRQP